MDDGWTHRIYLGDIFGDPTMPFEERRREITRRIGRSWFHIEAVANGDRGISDLLRDLRESPTPEVFDYFWTQFYGWADLNSVLVETDPREE